MTGFSIAFSGFSNYNYGLNNTWGQNNQYQNQQNADHAIMGCMKSFGIMPSGNKGADMMNLMGKMIQGVASGNINPMQGESISRLMDQLGIQKTGDKNGDFVKMLGALSQGGQQQNNSQSGLNNFNPGNFFNQLNNYNSAINNLGTNNNSYNNQTGNQQNTDHAIRGCMKAFGVRPTGNKGADMMKLIGGMTQAVASGNVNPMQGESISRLMDQLGIQKTGDKNGDFVKMLGALIQGGQQQTYNTNFFS